MVLNNKIRERLYLPAVHASHDLGGGINAPKAQRNISPDLSVALAAKHLHGAGNAVQAGLLRNELPTHQFVDDSSRNPQARIRLEVLENAFAVFRAEGDVGVEIPNIFV